VTRTIESLCGNFNISLLDRSGAGEWVFVPNLNVDISITDNQVMIGRIDRIAASISAEGKKLTISGRERTSLLADGSVTNLPGSYKETDLFRLARAIGSQYNIQIVNEITPDIKFPFKFQSGESAWEALNRANEFQGAMLVTDRLGRLVLSKPGGGFYEDEGFVVDDLLIGGNILEARMEIDYSNRFSDYTCKGQSKVKNGSGWDATQKVNFEAQATDPVIARQLAFHPKLFQAESQTTQKGAQRRVNLEASVRAARAAYIQVKVQGWAQTHGKIWPVNRFCLVNIPEFQLEYRKMLIVRTTFTRDISGGTTTTIVLRREDAYQQLVKKAVREGTTNSYGW
jgi:prophage tail gpP-like protein